ncbi:MAG: hypothetical protein GY812_07610 [Actinomycetia bacterium]|nr:hypothetical protein [Actinomycetes bacterium]
MQLSRPPSPEEYEAAAATIEQWLDGELDGNPAVAAAQRDPDPDARRWMVRLNGEEKEVFTVWLDLRQRSLHAETQLVPAPLEPPEALWEYLLRSVDRLRSVALSIGAEEAVYARMELPIEFIDAAQLDRVLGSLHQSTEQLFVPAMRLGFGDRFKR